MASVKIARIRELAPGQMKRIPVGARNVLLVNLGGTFHALDDKCPHLGGSLAGGRLDGGRVTCPRHGSTFDVATGKNVGNAKIAFISIRVDDATSYPVRVVGEDVFVEMG